MARAARTVMATAVSLLCLAAGPASADVAAEQVITGEHLQLISVTSPAMSGLSPGETATWDVGVSVTSPGDATVDVTLQVLAATEDAFEVSVARCDQRWTAAGCDAGEVALAGGSVTAGERTSLGTTDAQSDPWYRVTVTMVGSNERAQSSLQLIADGVGEELVAGPGPGASPPTGPMPDTGAGVLGRLALAVGAIVSGLALAAIGRRRRAPSPTLGGGGAP